MNGEVSKVIVAYPDRLTKFDFKTPEEFFRMAIISRFAGKLYGMRSNKCRKVVEGAKKLIQDP